MTIRYSREFERNLRKLKKANSSKLKLVLKKIRYFSENPNHPSLRFHRLSGGLKEYFSFSVGANFRIIFSWKSEEEVLFYKLGTHDEVYRQN